MTIVKTSINNETGIYYLSADMGGLTLTTQDEVKFWSKNVVELAKFVKEKGLATTIYGSSSMDFAEEYGFDYNDAAQDMWNDVLSTDLV